MFRLIRYAPWLLSAVLGLFSAYQSYGKASAENVTGSLNNQLVAKTALISDMNVSIDEQNDTIMAKAKQLEDLNEAFQKMDDRREHWRQSFYLEKNKFTELQETDVEVRDWASEPYPDLLD